MKYGYTREANADFGTAVACVKEGLQKEGFGILTEIDVKATMKKKLNAEYDKYLILRACNPALAHRALSAEKEIGLLLPCNVIIYESVGRIFVSAALPTAMMSIAENDELRGIAAEAEMKLKRAMDSVGDRP